MGISDYILLTMRWRASLCSCDLHSVEFTSPTSPWTGAHLLFVPSIIRRVVNLCAFQTTRTRTGWKIEGRKWSGEDAEINELTNPCSVFYVYKWNKWVNLERMRGVGEDSRASEIRIQLKIFFLNEKINLNYLWDQMCWTKSSPLQPPMSVLFLILRF